MGHSERYKIIPSVYLIPIREGEVLLSRRQNTGYEDGNYGLVSGHVEAKETFREALVREVREEVGVELSLDDLKLVHTMHRNHGDHERVDFFFTTERWTGETVNKEPEKCDDLQWFLFDQLPRNTILYIRYALECYQTGKFYSEFGWKV